MSDVAESLSRGLLAKDHRSKGVLVDLNTGTIRPDHVLVQRTLGADLFIGFGSGAGRLFDFAFDGETKDDPFLATCASTDRMLSESDLAKADKSGLRDALAKIAEPHLRRLAIAEAMLEKASVDDPLRPGWAAGTPGGLGGKFRPKDTSTAAREATEEKIKRLAARTAFKIAASAALKLGVTAALNLVPGENVVADVVEVIELGRTAIQLGNLVHEVNATIDFVRGGPYTLDDLQVSQGGESFSSMDAFVKVSPAIAALIKRFGSAPAGSEYHHIVEQGGANETNFTAEQLHNTDDVVVLPKLMHELVSAEYSKESPDDPTKTVREWLQGKSFEFQREYGIKTLQKFGLIK